MALTGCPVMYFHSGPPMHLLSGLDIFRQATPIGEIAELKIGSRPASRTSSDAIEDLGTVFRSLPGGR
jgi:hypothetical protein